MFDFCVGMADEVLGSLALLLLRNADIVIESSKLCRLMLCEGNMCI